MARIDQDSDDGGGDEAEIPAELFVLKYCSELTTKQSVVQIKIHTEQEHTYTKHVLQIGTLVVRN